MLDATGATTQPGHDAAGNVLTRVDARGASVTYTYDALNRIATETYADQSITYIYDQGSNGKGRLTTITDASGQTVLAYDALGRLVSDERTVDALTGTVGYDYDAFGRRAGMTYPSDRQLTYAFDAAGRIARIDLVSHGGRVTTLVSNVKYEPFAGVASFTFGTGSGQYVRTRDLDGRVASYTLGGATYTLEYDDAHNVTAIHKAGDPAATRRYGYDALDRLVASGFDLQTPEQAFTYDATGNRTSKSVSGASSPYTIDPASNRLTAVDGLARTYDAAGNLWVSPGRNFTYDQRGRLKEVSFGGTATYAINWAGQRVKKAVNGVATYFAYDDAGHLIGEYDSTGMALREMVWLGDTPVAVLSAQTRQAGADEDIDGDGLPDILLRNTANGDNHAWFLNADYTVRSSLSFGNVPLQWDLAGLADIDRNGSLDFLWRDSVTGYGHVWYLDGAQYVGDAPMFLPPPPWKVAALADFNGDGKVDAVLRNRTTNDVFVWYYDGVQYLSGDYLTTMPAGLDISGTGDFNADGKPDIVVRDTANGNAFVWYFDDAAWLGVDYLGTIDLAWAHTRVADFNRDGRPDLMAREGSSGIAFVWYFQGAVETGNEGVFMADAGWQQAPVGEAYQKRSAVGAPPELR